MAFMEVYDHKTPSIYHMKNSKLAVSKTKTVKHIKDGLNAVYKCLFFSAYFPDINVQKV